MRMIGILEALILHWLSFPSSNLYLWTFRFRDFSQSGDILQSLVFVDQEIRADSRKYFGKSPTQSS